MPMATALSSTLSSLSPISPLLESNCLKFHAQRRPGLVVRCESSSGEKELKVGSPIVVIEAPPTLKTASQMPSLRVNAGLVKPGDVGRIVARKPKDVWAVRLAIGTYLIDGKHFKPLDVDE
ncbi:protein CHLORORESPIRATORY REDUCTION 42, chloroplastic [Typha angustifolia]|uniref:protein CHLORORESPIRATORY REDUCTION 42, chloroplastic n=1 Tax=Typha angustifolia TaxID=59011 RepID=UPI003C2FC367